MGHCFLQAPLHPAWVTDHLDRLASCLAAFTSMDKSHPKTQSFNQYILFWLASLWQSF